MSRPASSADSLAILEASVTPILLASSKGPLVHLRPTLAPRSTSSMLQIPSSTIWEHTAKACPISLSLIFWAASSSQSPSSSLIPHISPSSTRARMLSAPANLGTSSCSER